MFVCSMYLNLIIQVVNSTCIFGPPATRRSLARRTWCTQARTTIEELGEKINIQSDGSILCIFTRELECLPNTRSRPTDRARVWCARFPSLHIRITYTVYNYGNELRLIASASCHSQLRRRRAAAAVCSLLEPRLRFPSPLFTPPPPPSSPSLPHPPTGLVRTYFARPVRSDGGPCRQCIWPAQADAEARGRPAGSQKCGIASILSFSLRFRKGREEEGRREGGSQRARNWDDAS